MLLLTDPVDSASEYSLISWFMEQFYGNGDARSAAQRVLSEVRQDGPLSPPPAPLTPLPPSPSFFSAIGLLSSSNHRLWCFMDHLALQFPNTSGAGAGEARAA
jgi:hypothetical protein